jgi:hypothetical protein
VAKFTSKERSEIQNIVANLSIKRIPDQFIIQNIKEKTGHSITRMTLWNIRQRIKKESYKWYQDMREGEYEYLHEFKERINEIVDLQRMHHEIISKNNENPSIVQTSLSELHKLNLTLSNYFDVAPDIIGNTPIPKASQKKFTASEKQEAIIV